MRRATVGVAGLTAASGTTAVAGQTATATGNEQGPDNVTVPTSDWSESVSVSGNTSKAVFHDAASLGDGSVLLAGELDAFSTDGTDGWYARIGSDGGLQWQEFISESLYDRFDGVAPTADGGAVLCGHSTPDEDDSSTTAVFVRVDEMGEVQAKNTFQHRDSTAAHAVVALEDGEFLVVGEDAEVSWYDVDTDTTNGWMVRVDGDGQEQWEQTVQRSGYLSLTGAVSGTDGSVFAIGRAGTDGLLTKISSDGVVEWQQTFGGSEYDEFHDIALNDDVLGIAGYTDSYDDGRNGWLVLATESGEAITSKTFSGEYESANGETARAITGTPDGGFITAGEFMKVEQRFLSSSYTYLGGVLRSFSASGDHRWQRIHDANRNSRPLSVVSTGENGYVVAGGYVENASGYVSDLRVVENEVPVPEFEFSPSSPGLESVSFDAAKSTDGDGTIESYEWDIDGDGTFESTGQTVTHEFTDEGDRRVSLRVTDDRGTTATKSVTLTVDNEPPRPAFGMNRTATAGTPLTFYAGNQTVDPDGDVATYEWDLDGDGEYEAEGAQVTATYNETGPHNVTLRAVDDVGEMATNTTTVDVRDSGLVGGFGPLLPGWATVAVPLGTMLAYALAQRKTDENED